MRTHLSFPAAFYNKGQFIFRVEMVWAVKSPMVKFTDQKRLPVTRLQNFKGGLDHCISYYINLIYKFNKIK